MHKKLGDIEVNMEFGDVSALGEFKKGDKVEIGTNDLDIEPGSWEVTNFDITDEKEPKIYIERGVGPYSRQELVSPDNLKAILKKEKAA